MHTTHVSLVGHVKLLGITAPAVERPFLRGDLEASRVTHERAVERLEGHDGTPDLILSQNDYSRAPGGRRPQCEGRNTASGPHGLKRRDRQAKRTHA